METTPGPDGGTPAPEGSAGPVDAGPDEGATEVGDEVRRPEDASDEAEDGHVPHEPLPFQKWVKGSATGAVLSGIALGLQEVLQPKRELPAFVMEAPGEPEDPDAPITLHFDPDDPTKTVAVIRDPARRRGGAPES